MVVGGSMAVGGSMVVGGSMAVGGSMVVGAVVPTSAFDIDTQSGISTEVRWLTRLAPEAVAIVATMCDTIAFR